MYIRRKLVAGIIGLGILAVMTLLAKPYFAPAPVRAAEDAAQRTLEVSGQGLVNLKPDLASISFGVTTRNKEPKTAQQDNADKMDKVMKTLNGMGIKADDITTVAYNISPDVNYDSTTQKERILGYVVTNEVQVTVRNITLAGQVLDAVVDAGVNNADSIRFGVSDAKRTEAYHKALELALTAARAKAVVMAKTLGIQINQPQRIVESSVDNPIIPQRVMRAANEKADMAATPISSGELEVRASVGLVYGY